MTTATRNLTIPQKSAAVKEAENTDNVREAVRKWKVNPSTNCKWYKNNLRIEEDVPSTPCAPSLFVKFSDQ